MPLDFLGRKREIHYIYDGNYFCHGRLYMYYIGTQSLNSASNHDDHKHKWYEIEASYYGKRHFTRKYGDAVWTPTIEKAHPTHK